MSSSCFLGDPLGVGQCSHWEVLLELTGCSLLSAQWIQG